VLPLVTVAILHAIAGASAARRLTSLNMPSISC
jgi:hypothetical protein